MTGIKALDKLRAYEDVDRFEAMEPWDIAHIADEIEREIEERYMVLPVDVNNEPVHIGDEMEHRSKHETLNVIAVGNDSFFTGRWADEYVRCVRASAEWHHVKPRTLTDVLADLFERKMSVTDAEHEIRELLAGDAE